MLNGEVRQLPFVEIQSDWFRLIPSRFPPVSIYQRVVANDLVEKVVETEDLTNPRLRAATRLTGGVAPVDPTSPTLQNWNLAPFSYPNPEGAVFVQPNYSCLELGDSLQAALAVSVRKRETFLRRTEEAAISLEMRAIKTPVTGRFVDLRSLGTNLSKEDRWAIGDSAIESSYDGLLFNRRERSSSSYIAVLNGNMLGRSQQTQHFKFIWNGERIVTIVSFGDVSEISPDDLGKSDAVIL